MNIRTIIFALVLMLGIGTWHAIAQEDEEADAIIKARVEATTFRPVEEILASPLEVTNFANDGSATLPIETTVPVACSIVYGTTPEFGSLSVDQDMAGGAHAEHNPLLSGLEPETTYYFRVQGIDEDGIIYLSDVLTFTTPKFEIVTPTNLASPELGATITGYSSAFGNAPMDGAWGAGNAFDDNPNTQWSSAGDGDSAWIEVELAQPAQIDSVEFWTRTMSNGTATTLAFTVTTDDGTVYGPFEIPDAEQAYTFEVEIIAQTLRFDLVETTGGNTGVVNIAVYGEFVK